jgi:hypothetical protein
VRVDAVFVWIEATALSTWLRESPSIMVFPFVLILHTVGLAFLVGANVAVDARVIGMARGVPLASLERYFRVMWAGFWLNAASGVLLLIAYPTKALTNPVFYLKLVLIGAALLMARAIRRHMALGAAPAGVVALPPVKALAVLSLACWAASITAGRLLAYTCTRLTADSTC